MSFIVKAGVRIDLCLHYFVTGIKYVSLLCPYTWKQMFRHPQGIIGVYFCFSNDSVQTELCNYASFCSVALHSSFSAGWRGRCAESEL